MSFTHNDDDFEATDSFEMPRILDHDDLEDSQPFEGPATNPDASRHILRAGLGDPRGHMPVSLSHIIYDLVIS